MTHSINTIYAVTIMSDFTVTELQYLLEWRMRFVPLNLMPKCEVVLNLSMKHWTGPHQTGPCGAKPWAASQNHRVRYPLFWAISYQWLVIPYWHFRTNYRSHLQGSWNQKREQRMAEFKLHNLLFWNLSTIKFFTKTRFGSHLCFYHQIF